MVKFDDVNDQFDRLLTLQRNWDGYNADPPTHTAVALARVLAGILLDAAEVTPFERFGLHPTRPGGVQIEWETATYEHELEVRSDGTLEVLNVRKADGACRTTTFDLARGTVDGVRVNRLLRELPNRLVA
jgi:hypothetical protein